MYNEGRPNAAPHTFLTKHTEIIALSVLGTIGITDLVQCS